MKIETFKLTDLHPAEHNERRNEQTAEVLTEVIKRYGYLVPMVVTESGEIVAGHARYKALTSMGVPEVSCVVIADDQELVREYRLFDNLIHDLSRWDNTMLGTELRDLEDIRGLFPDIHTDAIAPELTVGEVSMADVEAAKDRLGRRYEEHAAASQARLVKVQCHGCGESFKVLRRDLVQS